MNNNRLSITERRILEAIKTGQEIPNKNGRYNILFTRALFQLSERKIIALEAERYVIIDQIKADLLLTPTLISS